MLKLLIVSHNYPPILNARSFRWSALAERWAGEGMDVVVVTSMFPGAPSLENIRGVTVHRVGSGFLEKIRGTMAPLPAAVPSRPQTRFAGFFSHLQALLRRMFRVLHDHTWKKVYWPDSTALWIKSAVREGSMILAADPVRILVSVSLPFSSHLVGLQLKRRFPALRWIADIGDPFAAMKESPTNNHFLYQLRNESAERRILSIADAVSVTTGQTLQMYERQFPEVVGKIVEIPPLLVDGEPAIVGLGEGQRNPRLVYVGTLHRSIRSPERLLRLYGKILQLSVLPIELHFYGNHAECSGMFAALPPQTRQWIFLHGVVDRHVAMSAMRESTALVNIGNETSYQLPSKLVEYASIGKPIVNVVGRNDDSSVEFLKSHPCTFEVVGDRHVSDAIALRVIEFLNAERDPGKCLPPKAWFEQFSLPRIAASYERLFI